MNLPASSLAQLPVGVLLPTRNSRPHLSRHLEMLAPSLPWVEEIVVVDSFSEDGTVEELQKHLPPGRTRFLTHPPGLYESWNFGLRQLKARYTYIATIGDAASLEVLQEMVRIAESAQADVLITPPQFSGPKEGRAKRQWPIHQWISWRGKSTPTVIHPWEAFLWCVLSVPGSLLGSSASNLYRTQFLQAGLFPTDFGHAGDSAWALQNALRGHWVVAPQLHAEFLLHERSKAKKKSPAPGSVRLGLHQLARTIFQSLEGSMKDRFADGLEKFWEESLSEVQANRRYHEIRRASALWFLAPKAWSARTIRQQHQGQAGKIRHALLEQLKQALAEEKFNA